MEQTFDFDRVLEMLDAERKRAMSHTRECTIPDCSLCGARDCPDHNFAHYGKKRCSSCRKRFTKSSTETTECAKKPAKKKSYLMRLLAHERENAKNHSVYCSALQCRDCGMRDCPNQCPTHYFSNGCMSCQNTFTKYD